MPTGCVRVAHVNWLATMRTYPVSYLESLAAAELSIEHGGWSIETRLSAQLFSISITVLFFGDFVVYVYLYTHLQLLHYDVMNV